jgi:hypothetical protein
MSDLERLLVPVALNCLLVGAEKKCTSTTLCHCRKDDTHIRVYRCLTCHYEMRLTVWGIDPLDQLNTLVIEPDRPVVSFEAERHPIPDTPAA